MLLVTMTSIHEGKEGSWLNQETLAPLGQEVRVSLTVTQAAAQVLARLLSPGGLQGATRHLKECGQTTSSPGDSWSAQEPAVGRQSGAGPQSSACEERLAVPSLLSSSIYLLSRS